MSIYFLPLETLLLLLENNTLDTVLTTSIHPKKYCSPMKTLVLFCMLAWSLQPSLLPAINQLSSSLIWEFKEFAIILLFAVLKQLCFSSKINFSVWLIRDSKNIMLTTILPHNCWEEEMSPYAASSFHLTAILSAKQTQSQWCVGFLQLGRIAINWRYKLLNLTVKTKELTVATTLTSAQVLNFHISNHPLIH